METIGIDRDGDVLHVVIDHPRSAMNAVDATLHRELAELFAMLKLEGEARAIVLTGAGRAFSAGGDMSWFPALRSPDQLHALRREAKQIVWDLLDVEVPIVCAINGPAIGLGASIALLCDVIVMADDALEAQRADARTLVTLLHLRELTVAAGATVTVASEMLDEGNRQLAQVTRVDDVIVSDQIVSLLLAQISENEELAEVFDELFSAEGSEVYMRPVSDYVTPDGDVSFATLVAAAAARGESAIGYRSGGADEDFQVLVTPPKSSTFSAAPADRLIVLAEG